MCASGGDSLAQGYLSLLYLDGCAAFPEDAKKAEAAATAALPGLRELCEQGGGESSEQGDESSDRQDVARFLLGMFYLDGIAVPASITRGLQLLHAAAQAPAALANAQYALGAYYEQASKWPDHQQEALRYYRAAADQGHCQALFSVDPAGAGTLLSAS